MALPEKLVLVRHGESVGNMAIRASREEDNRYFTDDFRARHSAYWRLTPEGCAQAAAAGKWIRQDIGESFDGYFVSESVRAIESAALLELPGARWHPTPLLIDRNRGHFDVITREERKRRYPEELALKDRYPYLWTPPGGESMTGVRVRFHLFLNLLHREFDGLEVIAVTHGSNFDAARMTLEFLSIEEYNRIRLSGDPRDHTHNCQVLHYTRRYDPEDRTNERLYPHLAWVRSVYPLDPSRSKNGWERIERRTFTNEELLAEAERHPRLFSGE
jgi:broad specificity phosphatase PhoE